MLTNKYKYTQKKTPENSNMTIKGEETFFTFNNRYN